MVVNVVQHNYNKANIKWTKDEQVTVDHRIEDKTKINIQEKVGQVYIIKR